MHAVRRPTRSLLHPASTSPPVLSPSSLTTFFKEQSPCREGKQRCGQTDRHTTMEKRVPGGSQCWGRADAHLVFTEISPGQHRCLPSHQRRHSPTLYLE